MPAKARPRRPATRAAAVALPRRRELLPRNVRGLVRRLAPSRRSLALGLGLLVLAGAAYAIARETSIFAIERIDVRGGSPQVDAQVRAALSSFGGRSLVGLDGAAVVRRAEALPTVISASYDRSFPNGLRIVVVPERPVAVLRSGTSAWLLSARGRIMAIVKAHAEPKLPRIWLPTAQAVHVGALLPPAQGGVEARALALAGQFEGRVAAALESQGALVFRLRSGLELVLGEPQRIRIKLAVAARALALLPSGTHFLDVSVPGRPVAGAVLPPPLPQGSTLK